MNNKMETQDTTDVKFLPGTAGFDNSIRQPPFYSSSVRQSVSQSVSLSFCPSVCVSVSLSLSLSSSLI